MPVLNGPVAYLIDDEAIDVSRITGIPWCYRRVHQRGALHPFLDLAELDWWDRWRVAWTIIGGHSFLSLC
jgi:hypothetical protein